MLMLLFRFLKLVLRVTPPMLWWVLGGLVFCLLNNTFQRELWPNTPALESFFGLITVLCLLSLPWIAAYMAWRLADAVDNFFWKTIWRFVAVAGYVGAVISCLIGAFILMFLI